MNWRRSIHGRIALPLLDRVNNSVIDETVDLLAAQPGERVAEIGFGGGRGVRRLLHAAGPTGTVYAIDPSKTATRRLRKQHRGHLSARRLRVLRAPIHDLPCGRGLLDGVVTIDTVCYIDDLDADFADVSRVLVPGGRFVLGIGDPHHTNRRRLVGDRAIVRPVAAVTDRLVAAGFAIDEVVRLDATDDAHHVIRAAKQ